MARRLELVSEKTLEECVFGMLGQREEGTRALGGARRKGLQTSQFGYHLADFF
eukprot:CAMPEP_0172624728 /NCGR_PEP_ID=MMETSP1068-20121228/138878_1 /TAXON_ID=35684 /ORGANISM="Pseudopedinella elastica, Strain CCMP716" /LENGTH=52 /DNA_ID=CAMNT_0013433785 /DNA_START=11 /DNA_END=166 /DNA_ORIENTATION=-